MTIMTSLEMFPSDLHLQEQVPSIFATQPEQGVSDKYTFIPTTRIVGLLGENGWEISSARQVGSRKMDPRYAKHLVRFRPRGDVMTRDSSKVNEVFPELALYNSHNRQAGYRLLGGLYVKICSNGMCLSEKSFESLYMRHQDYTDDQVLDFSQKFVNRSNDIMNTLQSWRERDLSFEERHGFAREASRLRWESPSQALSDVLLSTHRPLYAGKDDLWSVFNVVQENLIRGGFRNPDTNHTVRMITELNRDRDVNQDLWSLGEKYLLN